MSDEVHTKPISQIIRALRHIHGNESDGIETKPCISNKQFPWIGTFSLQCWNVAQQPSAAKLDILITDLIKHLDSDIKQCYTRPKRANNLKQDISSFLKVFHWMYLQINRSLDHTMYLDKIGDILAHYIDLELKASRIGKEPERNIPQRIMTFLDLLLDSSKEHMIDAVMKARFVIKKYGELTAPIMGKLLEDTPREMSEDQYVRYVLAHKLWKKLAGKEDYAKINRLALDRLTPPPDFAENLKFGFYSNILPYISKPEKNRLTFFLMQSPISIKKKAQLFLKDSRKVQSASIIDQPIFNEDFQVTPFFENDIDETSDLLDKIWASINNNFISVDYLLESDTDEPIKENSVAAPIHLSGEELQLLNRPNNPVPQLAQKKRKATNVVGSCVGIQKPIVEKTADPTTTLRLTDSSKLMMKSEDIMDKSNSSFEEKTKMSKPCATVEPACSSENRTVEVFPTISMNGQKVSCGTNSGMTPSIFTLINLQVQKSVADMDADLSEPMLETDSMKVDCVNDDVIESNQEDMVIEGSADTVDSQSDVIIIEDDEKSNGTDLPEEMVEQAVVIGSVFIVNEPGTSGEQTVVNGPEMVVETDVHPEAVNKGTPLASPSNVQPVGMKPSPPVVIPEPLFSITASTDSWASNERMLNSYLFSEVNQDDASDEEVTHTRHVVGRGKVSAFKAHLEAEGNDSNSVASSQSLSGESSEAQSSPSRCRPDLQPRVMIENMGQLLHSAQLANCSPADTEALSNHGTEKSSDSEEENLTEEDKSVCSEDQPSDSPIKNVFRVDQLRDSPNKSVSSEDTMRESPNKSVSSEDNMIDSPTKSVSSEDTRQSPNKKQAAKRKPTRGSGSNTNTTEDQVSPEKPVAKKRRGRRKTRW